MAGSRNSPPTWRSNGQTFVHGSVQVERQISKPWLMGCSEGRANVSFLIEGSMGERSPPERWRCRRSPKAPLARDKTAIRFTGATVGSMPQEHHSPEGMQRGRGQRVPLPRLCCSTTHILHPSVTFNSLHKLNCWKVEAPDSAWLGSGTSLVLGPFASRIGPCTVY